MNYRNFYRKTFVSKKIWGFGALRAYVLFGGLDLLGAYLCLPYLGPLYIGAVPNFVRPPKLTALTVSTPCGKSGFEIIIVYYI
jgi:hypothetical protein